MQQDRSTIGLTNFRIADAVARLSVAVALTTTTLTKKTTTV